jgi:two-component system, OmpR family, sensor kinase
MAARLKASMQGQRRLLHDVSHELRSPLARLQAAAGLIRQNPDQLEAMITRIEEEIAHIDRFVGELLTLSRLEAGDLSAVEEEVDMRDLVRDVVQDANFEAQALEREVIWDDQGSAMVQGRAELLHSAIENIVRNALKHAPESRIVRVETSVDAVKRQYTLRVLDDGRGIPEDELHDLFVEPALQSMATGSASPLLGAASRRTAARFAPITAQAEALASRLCCRVVSEKSTTSSSRRLRRRRSTVKKCKAEGSSVTFVIR